MDLLSRILNSIGFSKYIDDGRNDYYEAPHKFDLEGRTAPAGLDSVINKFGDVAFSLMYRRSSFLIGKEIERFLWPKQTASLDKSYWHEKNPLNFPGPFYTGETDSCGTGPVEAPANVLLDAECHEFIFRQPINMFELLEVVNAGLVEVLDSYSCDGNDHWTYPLCKEWWRNRHDITAELRKPRAAEFNKRWTKLWDHYLQGDAETDLMRYCYFLEHGYYPPGGGVHLPPL